MVGGMLQILLTLLQVKCHVFLHSTRHIWTDFSGIPTIVEPKLAAIYSPVREAAVQTDRLNRGMLSIRPSKGVSPHIIMGKTD